MEYEYKQLTGASVGQFVDRFISGENLYINRDDVFYVIIGHPSISDIDGWLNSGLIYTRKEKPWWEGYEGTPVMVRNKEESQWRIDIFKKKYGNSFCCLIGEWKQARPLTTAERDAIKVRD